MLRKVLPESPDSLYHSSKFDKLKPFSTYTCKSATDSKTDDSAIIVDLLLFTKSHAFNENKTFLEFADSLRKNESSSCLRRDGVTVNIHSTKKALPSTYLLANKYSPVFFSRNKKTHGCVYLPVNKYCLMMKYLLPFSYSFSIIGHSSHRFTPKPSLRQIKSKFSSK